tara:strand:- start:252 stop:521 length:270 start_codon:yes stop_codon:yes gene_type:complete
LSSLNILIDHKYQTSVNTLNINISETNIDRTSIEYNVAYDTSHCTGGAKLISEEFQKNKAIIEARLPFAKNQPVWVTNLLFENFNIHEV